MNKTKWFALFVATVLLNACTPPIVTESTNSEPTSASESVTTLTPEYATDEITDHRKVSMDFDIIQPAGFSWSQINAVPSPEKGLRQYFTIERDGKWGLILANGMQVLPCLATEPVYLCRNQHWMWHGDGIDYAIDYAAADNESLMITGIPICGGHGGGSSIRFVDTKGDSKPQIFYSSEGSGGIKEVSTSYPSRFYATYFSAYIAADDDIPYIERGGHWNFTDQSGTVLFPNEQFSMVGEFDTESLTPVQKDGKWAYADSLGNIITDFVYENCWFSGPIYNREKGENEKRTPAFAYPLYRGFAPVKKDGKWGVLDSTGKEVISCEYEGAAPHPLGFWLKKDGVWEVLLREELPPNQ